MVAGCGQGGRGQHTREGEVAQGSQRAIWQPGQRRKGREHDRSDPELARRAPDAGRQCRAGGDPAGNHAGCGEGRDAGAGRAVGVGQVVAPDADGRAGAGHRRAGDRAGAGPDGDGRGRARAVPPGEYGGGVPVLPPDSDDDRAGERRGAAGTGRGGRRFRAGRGRIARGGTGCADRPLSPPDVGGRAAARRAGARRRAAARDPSGRRADGEPRRGERGRRSWTCSSGCATGMGRRWCW